MIKKTILLTSTIIATLSGSLSSENYRMGFSMGIAHHDIEVENKATQEKTIFIKSSTSHAVFIGLDHIVDQTPFFLGLELAGNNHNSEQEQIVRGDNSSQDYTLRLKTNNSLSGSLRIGVVSEETFVYAKTGLAWTNWQANSCLVGEPADKSKKSNFTKVGVIGGLGVESKLNPNVSLGLEHELVFSSAFEFAHNGEVSTVKPMAQKTSLRLTYNF